VGLSSVRLQRITQMPERHIAAGNVSGAVTVLADCIPRRGPERGGGRVLVAQAIVD
jgi:hypothetical protein